MLNKKGQSVATEFIFAVGAIVFIFIFLLSFVFEEKADVVDKEENLDRRAECLRISNLLSSVSAGGPGTEVKTKATGMVTIQENNVIYVGEPANFSILKDNIAILASEAGPTSLEFYNLVDSTFKPDWYKICFDDYPLTGQKTGCNIWTPPNERTSVNWSFINFTFYDLIKNISNDPDAYQTIYLEDPHIHPGDLYDGRSYLDILSDWVAGGRVLIIAEHMMCREEPGGHYSSTSIWCNPPGSYNGDVWDFLGARANQKRNNQAWIEVIIEPDQTLFKDLHQGNVSRFGEAPFIEDADQPEANFTIVAKYTTTEVMDNPAIAYWDYGNGKIFYFGDFQVDIQTGENHFTQDFYTGIISNVIENAYTIVIHSPSKEASCTFIGESPFYQFGTASAVSIRNVDNEIVIDNAG